MQNRAYVGFGKRLLAYLVDMILFMIVVTLISTVVTFLMFNTSDNPQESLKSYSTMMNIFIPLLLLLYFALMESSAKQGTLGKMLMKIKVINAEGERLSKKDAFIRNIARYLSGIILGLGYIMIMFTKEKQSLHDKLAKTYVIAK
jgi:uncharacterized RDD family membrane protein YckC